MARTTIKDDRLRYHVQVRIPRYIPASSMSSGHTVYEWRRVHPTRGAPYEFSLKDAEQYVKVHTLESRRAEPNYRIEPIYRKREDVV